MNTKKIVIIGNGIGGSQAAAKLAKAKKYDITVVTPFRYQEVMFMRLNVDVSPFISFFERFL